MTRPCSWSGLFHEPLSKEAGPLENRGPLKPCVGLSGHSELAPANRTRSEGPRRSAEEPGSPRTGLRPWGGGSERSRLAKRLISLNPVPPAFRETRLGRLAGRPAAPPCYRVATSVA